MAKHGPAEGKATLVAHIDADLMRRLKDLKKSTGIVISKVVQNAIVSYLNSKIIMDIQEEMRDVRWHKEAISQSYDEQKPPEEHWDRSTP